jgi:beta-N-acetylhexosaminidase
MPVVRVAREALIPDISAFRAVKDAPMGMTAHLAFTAFDDEKTAATLSAKIISEVIRKDIGFKGLLMTDDLGMKALGGTLADRANRALAAGCDVILHCAGFVKEPDGVLAEMTEVAEACPALAGDSLKRAVRAEGATGDIGPFDRAEGWERLEKLLSSTFPSGTAAA